MGLGHLSLKLLTLFVSRFHHLVPPPFIFSFPEEAGNGPSSASVIWLKLVWFPLRKGWQSLQCWLVPADCCAFPSSPADSKSYRQPGRLEPTGCRQAWFSGKLKDSVGSWAWTRLSLKVYTENCSPRRLMIVSMCVCASRCACANMCVAELYLG